MKRKLNLLFSLILMAVFFIGFNNVNAAETKKIQFESRGVMEVIKASISPSVKESMIDTKNLTLTLTQEQIDSVTCFGVMIRGDSTRPRGFFEYEIANILGVEYDKNTLWENHLDKIKKISEINISLKGIENFKNIEEFTITYDQTACVNFIKKNIDCSALAELPKLRRFFVEGVDKLTNVDSLSKIENLKSISIRGLWRGKEFPEGYRGSSSVTDDAEYVGPECDLTQLFPLSTKNTDIKISLYQCKINEDKMWNYIENNSDKNFKLEMIQCGLTYVKDSKNVEIIDLGGNNIKNIASFKNIDINSKKITINVVGNYIEENDEVGYLTCIMPFSGQKLETVSETKTFTLPDIFNQAGLIEEANIRGYIEDNPVYEGGEEIETTFKYNEIYKFKLRYLSGAFGFAERYFMIVTKDGSIPEWTKNNPTVVVTGATLSEDGKQIIFSKDAKNGDQATIEIKGGIAHGTKMTVTYKAKEEPKKDETKNEENIIEKIYKFLNGAEQSYKKGNKEKMTFRVDGELNLFSGAYIDSVKLDSASYTLEEGSTIIKLTEEYTNKLSAGKHTLLVTYTDGGKASTTFTVLESDYKQNPDTGLEFLAYEAMKI